MILDFKTEVPKGVGIAFANLVRHLAYTNCDGWRPIGFKVLTAESTVLSAKGLVEDSLQINADISNLTFTPTEDPYLDTVDFMEIKISSSNGVITTDDIINSTKLFRITGESKNIITSCTNPNVLLCIYLHKDKGVQSAEANRKVFKAQKFDLGKVRIMSSKHTQVQNVSFNVIEEEFYDIVEFHIKGISDTQKLENLLKQISDTGAAIFTQIQEYCQ